MVSNAGKVIPVYSRYSTLISMMLDEKMNNEKRTIMKVCIKRMPGKGYFLPRIGTLKQIRSIFYSTILSVFFLLLISCDDMHDQDPNQFREPVPGESGKLYVLSEGLFNMNNSSLAMFNPETGKFEKDIFLARNKRGLGDTANDMALYGGKLYVVVNVSSQIEVIDAETGISLQRIPMFDDRQIARQPRFITFHQNKAYVCSFDGTVARIDTASLKIDGIVNAGRNPDGICVSNGKLYVSNSGGLNFPEYDNTVSVIDIQTFTETDKITVAVNPSFIHADSQGDVYVVSRGDYGKNQYQFQRIDAKKDVLAETFAGLDVLNFTIHKDTAYLYSYDFSSGKSWIKVFDCATETILQDQFISDGTAPETPSGIQVNPINGDVYLTDAKSYIVMGDVLCYDKKGKLKYRINEVGLNPNKVVFR